jgi:hypothetical protein
MLELAHEAHVDPDLWGQFGPGAAHEAAARTVAFYTTAPEDMPGS